MAEGPGELLRILMRWVHVASAAVLVGGMFYARFIADEGPAAAPRRRLWVWGAAGGLTASGLYHLLAATGHSRYYYAWLAAKLLLALHVFVCSALAFSSQEETQRRRRAASAALSGLLVLLLAAYLRRIY